VSARSSTLTLAAVAAVAVFLGLYVLAAGLDATDALCDTDSDCAELCAADDIECDGGPQ
jgi:hypothetical protein